MCKLNGILCGVVALSLFVGCGSALAEKAQLDNNAASEIILDVVRIEACVDATDNCSVAGGPKQMNLFDLAEGKVDFAKQVLLPDNTTELRLVLGDKSTVAVNGKSFSLTVPSGRTSGLKLKGKNVFAEKGGLLASLTLNFDLSKMLVEQKKNGTDAAYSLKPVIQAASANITPLPENTVGAVVLPEQESVITMGNAFTLSVPSGAVSGATVLTVEEIKNYIEVIDHLTQQIIVKPDLASTFKLEPDGFVFAKPLHLTLKYNIAALRDKFTENDLTIRHSGHKVETTLDTYQQLVAGEINHFSSVTISTYPGVCKEKKVGNFNNNSIKYFDCAGTSKYPHIHVAVADRAALATTYELQVLAAHNSGETSSTFRT